MEGLGRFFAAWEFTRNGRNLPNEPTPEQWARIQLLVRNLLDPLREGLGVPVGISSGFRSATLNEAVNGSTTSQHMDGEAVDIKAKGYTASDIIRVVLRLKLPFDQIIGYVPEHGGHVHLSYTARRANRNQILWVPPGPKRYTTWDRNTP